MEFNLINGELIVIMKQELTCLLNAPVVFAHNDLLCGNFMVNDDEGTMTHDSQCIFTLLFLISLGVIF